MKGMRQGMVRDLTPEERRRFTGSGRSILDRFKPSPSYDPPTMSPNATEAEPPAIVDSITVRQDVGGPYPVYKMVTLDLHDDGTVTWRDREWTQ